MRGPNVVFNNDGILPLLAVTILLIGTATDSALFLLAASTVATTLMAIAARKVFAAVVLFGSMIAMLTAFAVGLLASRL